MSSAVDIVLSSKLSDLLFPKKTDPSSSSLLKITREDMDPLIVPVMYEEVPDVIEYKRPDTIEVLPHIRCLDCSKYIFQQSQVIRQKLDKEDARVRLESAERGVERGMTVSEYNSAIEGIVTESGLKRACCRMYAVEQLIVPMNVSTSIDRFVPSEGDVVARGNVKIRYLPQEKRKKIPYNPYTFSMSSLLQEWSPEKIEDEDELEPAQKRLANGPVLAESDVDRDKWPSMPEIDDTFEEEASEVYVPPTNEYVAGLVYTGVPKYESPLISGRTINAW